MFGLGRELVCEMRFAVSALDAALPDQTVALECQQMRPHGVIRHRKFFSQFIDCAGLAAQQGHNTPARALEKTLAQFGLLHISPPLGSISAHRRKHNKSRKSLTYFYNGVCSG